MAKIKKQPKNKEQDVLAILDMLQEGGPVPLEEEEEDDEYADEAFVPTNITGIF